MQQHWADARLTERVSCCFKVAIWIILSQVKLLGRQPQFISMCTWHTSHIQHTVRTAEVHTVNVGEQII